MIGYKSGITVSRGNSHDFCEVVTRMLYGNVQQIDKHYYPPFFNRLIYILHSEHSLMVELHYVIVQSTGSSPVVLAYELVSYPWIRKDTGRVFQ